MKTVFDKKYLLDNLGCYSEKRMEKLTSHIQDDSQIHIHEILDAPKVSLIDKYYFVFANCGINKKDVLELVIQFLIKAKEHLLTIDYSKDLLEIVELVINNHASSTDKKNIISKKLIIEDMITQNNIDQKYIAKGIAHIINFVGRKGKYDKIVHILLRDAFLAIKQFDMAIVSRKDLLDDLMKYLKNYTSN